ncbi:putative terpene synthase 9 isoform X1 [Castanea sativa]|uniref:putative terpene synthase 9 isoform X1 n=1 Tax=Castanea sativa TaxID=21020 RepID=UPI003F64F039
MELIRISSSSPLDLTSLNYKRSAALTRKQTTIRCHKQGLSALPMFIIVSKFNDTQVNPRRSANYHPSIWDQKLIESFNTPYSYEFHGTRLKGLRQYIKTLLTSTKDQSFLLKLIDSMQRLGVAYHFEQEIEEVLKFQHPDVTSDLYTTALQFRILREHGFSISSDVFDKFRSRDGKFMDSLSLDIEGLESLYEASHLGMGGESIAEEAKNFSMKNLKSLMEKLDSNSAKQVKQSLEVPLYWRVPRVEVRKFIGIYEKDSTKNLPLLELAKLDYNLVQSVHQRELKELQRWWRDLGLAEELTFSRDRLMENYLWAMGIVSEPQFSKCRIGLTKFVCILTVIDDMYDVYGSLDELERFTDAVDRWEMKAMEDLPEYMKVCYVALLNFANEMVCGVIKDHGFNTLPYIKAEWANLCRAYLVEARWFYSGYIPTVDEYLENACISVGGHAAMVHAYILQGCTLTNDSLDCIKSSSDLIYWSSLITRLSDDLGTEEAESERGDVAKSIRCYMVHEGVPEVEAKHRIKEKISYSWKKLNKEIAKNSLPKSIVKMSLNMARTAQCIFQHGDGIGTSTGVMKDRLSSLIVKPIPI